MIVLVGKKFPSTAYAGLDFIEHHQQFIMVAQSADLVKIVIGRDIDAAFTLYGFDQYGDPIDRRVEGFHARVVQHECDHLWGKLYPMRVRDFSQFGYTEVLFPEIA